MRRDAGKAFGQRHRLGKAGAFQPPAGQCRDAGGILEDALDEAEAAFGQVDHVCRVRLLFR